MNDSRPDGAERYYKNLPHPYLKMDNALIYYFYGTWQQFHDQYNALRSWTSATILPEVTTEQDLTTLDVPFGELDRDTQLRLVNHVLDGGDCECRVSREWKRMDLIIFTVAFKSECKYRAVAKQPEQPTERETLEAKLHEQWVELNATMKRITEIK